MKKSIAICGIAAAHLSFPVAGVANVVMDGPTPYSPNPCSAGQARYHDYSYYVSELHYLTSDVGNCTQADIQISDFSRTEYVTLGALQNLNRWDESYDFRGYYSSGACPGKAFGTYGSLSFSDAHYDIRCEAC